MITMLQTVGAYTSGSTYNLASTVEIDYINRGYARLATQAEALNVSGSWDQTLIGELTEAGGPNALQTAIAAAANAGNGVVNVKDYGAKIDGSTDDTEAIQTALDDAPIGSTIYVPAGVAKVTRSGSDAWCLNMTRKVNLFMDGLIRADLGGGDSGVDLLRIAVDDAGGNGDVRGHHIRFNGYLNGGGRSAIRGEADLPVLRMVIEGGVFAGLNGPGLFLGGGYAHTVIRENHIGEGVQFSVLSGAYPGDAQIVENNLIYGERTGVILDVDSGCYSHRIVGNTIVTENAAIDIVNASQVKIRDNQIEQPEGSTNAHPYPASLVIQGTRYTPVSCDVTGNNFGGGTNVQYSIIAIVSDKLVLDENDFNIANVADIVLATSSVTNTHIGRGNRYRGSRGGATGYAALYLSDSGVRTTGYRRSIQGLSYSNSWASSDGFVVASDGRVTFSGTLTGGTLTAGTTICTLPDGYRPYQAARCPVVTSGGMGWLNIATTGVVTVGSAPGATVYLDGVVFDTPGDL